MKRNLTGKALGLAGKGHRCQTVRRWCAHRKENAPPVKGKETSPSRATHRCRAGEQRGTRLRLSLRLSTTGGGGRKERKGKGARRRGLAAVRRIVVTGGSGPETLTLELAGAGEKERRGKEKGLGGAVVCTTGRRPSRHGRTEARDRDGAKERK